VNELPAEVPPVVVTVTDTVPDIPEGTFITILVLLQE
jgi:hypothetical protein